MVDALTLVIQANFVLTFALIVPIIINVKYYLQFKIPEYGMMSLYFSLWLIDALLPTLWGSVDVTPKISWANPFVNPATMIVLWLVIRMSRESIPSWFKVITPIYIIITYIALIINLNSDEIPEYRGWPISQYIRVISWIVIYAYMSYIIFNMEIVQGNSRALKSKMLWILSFAGLFVTMVLNALMIVLNIDFLSMPLWLLLIALYCTAFGGIAQMINHVFYPEAVLLSHVQVHRAIEMYNIFESKAKSVPFENLGRETLMNYIKEAKAMLEVEH